MDGAKDHIEMAQRVLDSDYLCPNFVSDKAQDIVNKVSLFYMYSPRKEKNNNSLFWEKRANGKLPILR